MPSVIFNSTACRQCDGKPLNKQERCVVRTSTEDICCNCGDVLQTFPAITSFSSEKNVIVIPDAVTETLVKLLKLRLFTIDSGKYPQIVHHNWAAIEKPPAHRIGHQALIELRGPGNCWAKIRWSYSRKDLLPSYLWHFNPKFHKQISLSDLDFVCPTRVVRARRALFDFDVTEGLLNSKERTFRIVRLEKRCDVPAQQMETMSDVCLVVKVQFEWLQVGTCFPSETGERMFKSSRSGDDLLTLEEAVDRAVNAALWHNVEAKVRRSDEATRALATVVNPCPPRKLGRYGDLKKLGRSHDSMLRLPPYREDFQGPFTDPKGRLLVPAGVEYLLEVAIPWVAQEDGGLKPCDVTVAQDRKVIFEQLAVGGIESGCYGTDGEGNNIYSLRLENLKFCKPGETVVTRIKDAGGGVKKKTYLFVSWKQYNAAWEELRAPYIDGYKESLCAEIIHKLTREQHWGYRPQAFSEGIPVAALISDRWYEVIYKAPAPADSFYKGGGHWVKLSTEHGMQTWRVTKVIALEDALQAGYDVAAPFDSQLRVGFESRQQD